MTSQNNKSAKYDENTLQHESFCKRIECQL